MTVLVKCDSCDLSADIDAEDCPDRLELWAGGDSLEGNGSTVVASWHASATCRARFLASVPTAAEQVADG